MRIQHLKKQLQLLNNFRSEDMGHFDFEVIKWISDCVSFFSSIGVKESIISGFMQTFENNAPEDISFKDDIGPFKRSGFETRYAINSYSVYGRRVTKLMYIEIAFKTSENILNNMEESERLISKPLLFIFSDKPQYTHIASSLELMEQNFEKKDSVGLGQNAIALLGSVLNLSDSLKDCDLSRQLSRLKSDKSLLNEFGVRSELITAFDNSRIIKNHIISHKNIPIEYDIPFAVSIGSAYLVVMFLQITISTGILIE